MEFLQFNIWAVLILIGVVQGIFLAVVFWNKKNNQKANRIFALLLMSVALHLLEYAFCISGVIFSVPHLFFTTYPLLFVFGPFFYLYVLVYLNEDLGKAIKISLHFLPALIVALSFIPFYQLSGQEKITLFLDIAADRFKEIPPVQFIIMFGQIAQILLYLLLANRIIDRKRKLLPGKKVNGRLIKIKWLKRATIIFTAFIIFYALITLKVFFSNTFRVEFDYLVALSMAVLIYGIGYTALKQPALFMESFQNGHKKTLLTAQSTTNLKKRLIQYMQQKQPYLEENVRIEDLASALEIPTHHLSELINQEFQCGFFDFINGYRIEEAKQLLITFDSREKKILAIAFESGFSNKATFNRVFKDFTGTTPSAYRKQHS